MDGDHPKELPAEGTVPLRQDIPKEGVAQGAGG